jgi:hypothetical protein
MPPDILALPLIEGTLFIGPAGRPAAVAGALEVNAGWRLREILARHAESWRLRNAVTVWGVQSFGRLERPERDLGDEIADLIESGRLSARFLPLFRDDPRGAEFATEWAVGPVRVHQLGLGPKDSGLFRRPRRG